VLSEGSVIDGESVLTRHSCWHDWQTSVTMTMGSPGIEDALRATPRPTPQAGHSRRTDMGMGL
jgi:hypothetical protein